ncbi:unnamed protein product [Ectocarpus fasciculatus]
MEDALKLQGYLMKEKSKLSRLHGLTGDINKRYFKIQSIEGSEELALCYYKKFNVPEIRGWIYLKDVTEIAEDQDTIIVTSAARTLHLYAQTRAQHNVWVTGLAKLCPHAFAMLGRNAPVQRMENDPRICSPTGTSLTKPAVVDKSFAKDHDKLVIDPHENHSVDGVESSPSTNESDSQSESFETARGHDTRRDRNGRHRGQSAGDHRAREELHASWSTPHRDPRNVAGKQRHPGDDERGRRGGVEHGSKGPCHRRRGEYEDRRLVRSSGRLVHRGNTCDKGSTRRRNEERQGHRSRGNGGESIAKANSHDEEESRDTSASPTRNCRNAGDTENDRATSKPRSTGLAASTSDEDDHEDVADERGLEPCGQNASLLYEGLNPTGVGEKVGTDRSDIVVVRPPEPQGDEMTKKPRAYYSSDNENVETIELDEGESPVVAHIVQARQPGDNPAPASVPRKSNQDEEKEEVDEEADIDLAVPRLEIGDWEGPHQGQSATSRLHRHISRRDTEAVGFSGGVPPPKEFLTHKLLESPSTTDYERNTGSDGLPKPTTNGRRRSAADLEWNDGGETPDRPRCTEATLTHSGDSRPAALDFEDHGGNNLNLEVEKQRRRAAAAVLALETAAKEADEGAQVESECLGDCKRDSGGSARGIVAKAYPSPAGPPPVELLRKSRRGRGAPPPGVAPPKTAPPGRVKPSNRPTDSDDLSTDDDRDDETKAPRNDSRVAGASEQERYSPAQKGGSGFPRQTLGRRQPNQWVHSDA